MLWVLRKGFQLLVPMVPRRDLEFLDLGLEVVLVGLGAPEETPEELPPERVVMEPLTPEPATG